MQFGPNFSLLNFLSGINEGANRIHTNKETEKNGKRYALLKIHKRTSKKQMNKRNREMEKDKDCKLQKSIKRIQCARRSDPRTTEEQSVDEGRWNAKAKRKDKIGEFLI